MKLKKFTQKDRYGNTLSYEYEQPTKQLDPTALMKQQMEMMNEQVPEMMAPPPPVGGEEFVPGNPATHPGGPKGQDTVPAWLTPGEFVVNAEAMSIPGAAEQIKGINDAGRAMQKGGHVPQQHHRMPGGEMMAGDVHRNHGGMIPHFPDGIDNAPLPWIHDYQQTANPPQPRTPGFNQGGDVPFIAAPMLMEPQYRQEGGDAWYNPASYFEDPAVPSPVMIPQGTGQQIGYDRLARQQGVPGANQAWPEPGVWDQVSGTAQGVADSPIGDAVGGVAGHVGDIPLPFADSREWAAEQGYPAIGINPETGESYDTGEALSATGDAIGSTWSAAKEKAVEHGLVPPSPSEISFPPAEDGGMLAQEEIYNTLEAADAGEELPIVSPDVAALLKEEGITSGNEEVLKESEAAEQAMSLEEFAKNDEYTEEDAPDKPSDKGTQTPEEVTTAGEEEAAKDPSALGKVGGFFKDAFSELLDGKELAKMSIMYLGSRALGYSHGGSLNWAANQYINTINAKQQAKLSSAAKSEERAFELAKSDKFTPESIAAYKKSGSFAALVPKGTPPQITGNTMARTLNGQKVVFQETKIGGNTMYVGPDGIPRTAAQIESNTNKHEPSFEKGTPEYRARRSRATGDAAGRFEEVWKAEDLEDPNDLKSGSTKIRPKQAADEFWGWSEKMGLDPESDEALNIMTNAYSSAIADSKGGTLSPTSLKPYLQQEYIRHKTGAPEVFVTNPEAVAKGGEATYVRADKMDNLMGDMEMIAANAGKDKDAVFQFVLSKWQGMTPEDQANYGGNKDESAFYNFAQQEMQSVLK